MAPVVHGLEQRYAGRVDFVYLDVNDARNADAKTRLGFRSTPHFFVVSADGRVLHEWQGVVSSDVVEARLQPALAAP
jgi:thioredoxin-like negative regulator of GroEL